MREINQVDSVDIKDLIQSELTCISENVVRGNAYDMLTFDLCSAHILHLVDQLIESNNYLLERLTHSEVERFKK